MITLHDMNQSWVPPVGFDFISVEPIGSYLVVTYARHQDGNDIARGGFIFVRIYLQDMGREVMRTVEEIMDPVVKPEPPEPEPIPARFKFWNGVLLALEGIREILACLKK